MATEKLTRPAYLVTLTPAEPDADPQQLRVVVTHGDQLRAELELNRRGIDLRNAMHLSTAFAWAAMKRTGDYAGNFDAFAFHDVLDLSDGGAEPVDPTKLAAATPSRSPSRSRTARRSTPS